MERVLPVWSRQRQIDIVSEAYSREIAQLKKTDREAADSLSYDGRFEETQRTDELYEFQSRWLYKKARHLYIDVPDVVWENGEYGGRFLPVAERIKLHIAVREQLDKRRDFYIKVAGVLISFVAVLTGMIGAVIGVLAFLKKAH